MRVRDHVALSTGVAALLYPRYRTSVVRPWLASILIDVDHYLWYSVRHRRLNPVTAVCSFNSAQPPKHPATRPFHHSAVLLSLLVLSARWRAPLVPVLVGMTFHVSLDRYHRTRTAHAQAAALTRDNFTCQVCGTKGPNVVPHLWRQPRLLPSYRVGHFVSVCGSCHEVAHAAGVKAIVTSDCDWNSYLQTTGLRGQSEPYGARD